MMASRGTKSKGAKRKSTVPAVGSKVRFVFGLSEVIGTVIEDRGNLGVGGRRLLRVRFEIEGAGEPFETEIAADDVKVAA
jgi:hypothetical protein